MTASPRRGLAGVTGPPPTASRSWTVGPTHDRAVSPDGRHLRVTIDARSAVELRAASSGRLLRRALLGGAPHDLAFAPGGRRIWLSNPGSPLLTVAGRPPDLEPASRHQTAPFRVRSATTVGQRQRGRCARAHRAQQRPDPRPHSRRTGSAPRRCRRRRGSRRRARPRPGGRRRAFGAPALERARGSGSARHRGAACSLTATRRLGCAVEVLRRHVGSSATMARWSGSFSSPWR